jgi:hypothetical protein
VSYLRSWIEATGRVGITRKARPTLGQRVARFLGFEAGPDRREMSPEWNHYFRPGQR